VSDVNYFLSRKAGANGLGPGELSLYLVDGGLKSFFSGRRRNLRVKAQMKLSWVIIFFFALEILLIFIIPPFQNPDEPQHFGAILTYTLGNDNKEFIEREIIKIMDENSWWRFVGLGRPSSLPGNFLQTDFLRFDDFKATFGNIILYHFLLGKIQKLFIKDNIILSYYFCRFISVLFLLISLYLAYLIFKKAFHINSSLFGVLFIFLLPQLGIIMTGVSSDALSLLLTCLFFFASFSLIIGNLKIGYFLLLFLSAAASLLTDRSILFAMPLTALVPLFLLKRKDYKTNLIIIIGFFFALTLFIMLLWKTFPVQFNNSLNIIKMHYRTNIQKILSLAFLNEFNRQSSSVLADSFLLKFGWMAFNAHKIFYYIWRIIMSLSFLGIVIYFIRYIYSRAKNIQDLFLNSKILKLILFSLIFISVQILNIWIISSPQINWAQGRYLFPVIIPIAFLFMLGLKTFFDMFHKRAGGIAISIFVVLEFLFLSYVIWNYVLPVFHLTIKSPHPGI
jgi:hypothetical protein